MIIQIYIADVSASWKYDVDFYNNTGYYTLYHYKEYAEILCLLTSEPNGTFLTCLNSIFLGTDNNIIYYYLDIDQFNKTWSPFSTVNELIDSIKSIICAGRVCIIDIPFNKEQYLTDRKYSLKFMDELIKFRRNLY